MGGALRELPRAEDLVRSDVFYETACYNILRAVQSVGTPRARRLAEREETYETLAQFGLIRSTRGKVPPCAVKSETVSLSIIPKCAPASFRVRCSQDGLPMSVLTQPGIHHPELPPTSHKNDGLLTQYIPPQFSIHATITD